MCSTLPLLGCRPSDREPIPAGYPSSYRQIIRAAKGERTLQVWSAVDKKKAQALITAFRRHYPFLTVEYAELPASGVYQRFVDAAARGQPTADFLWSSAMDLQIKLANDGYAQSYASPERDKLPDWANWKNQAWGTTAEPIVLLYNRRLIDPAAVPRDHAALTALLETRPKALGHRIATYDLPHSAVGYLYLMQDQQATQDVWRLVRAMGLNRPRLFASAEQIVGDVAAGRSAIGYNIVGSYALDEVERNPDLGMVLPRDYTLLMSRLAIIPTTARHPAAARLFLDYLLSAEGQSFLAAEKMPSVRSDVPIPATLHPADVRTRAIRVGPALLIGQDQLTRRYMLRKWERSIGAVAADNAE